MAVKRATTRKKSATKGTTAKRATKTKTLSISGIKARKGENLTKGGGWLLVATKGRKRVFSGRLVAVVRSKGQRLAVFNVPT